MNERDKPMTEGAELITTEPLRRSWNGSNTGRFKPTGLISDCAPVLALKEHLQIGFETFNETVFEEFNAFWDRVKAATSIPIEPRISYQYPLPPGPILSWEQCAAIPNRPGIYFIWNGKTVVYVGQSVNMLSRCSPKSHGKIDEGDWLSWIEFPVSELYFAECYYIGSLRPERNWGRGRSAE